MATKQFDVIVIGSGPAGVHAAYPIIKAGLNVAIIDGGLDSKKKDKNLNEFIYSSFRKTSNAYDLLRKSSYVFNKTYQLLKIKSEIEIIQSLAKGGLSNHWHGICDVFTNEELERAGLPAREIQENYKEVSKLINLKLESYLDSEKNQSIIKDKLYKVPLAYLYNTASEIENLRKHKNFTYIPNQLVQTIKDYKKFVEVQTLSIDKSKESKYDASYVILAAGSINTTRILLRSLNLYNYKTTFLTKANYISACLHLGKLETPSSGQMVITSKDTHQGIENFYIQFYKFNPQAIQKVLNYIPLHRFLSSPLLTLFAPSLMIADIRFPSFETKGKFVKLVRRKNDSDVLEISFKESLYELADHKKVFKNIKKQLHLLGLFPLKTIVDYTTSHYAGGIPYQQKPGKISSDINGKLHQAKRIYIADSSTWRALPAKAPTLTIMANASRVGKHVLMKYKTTSSL